MKPLIDAQLLEREAFEILGRLEQELAVGDLRFDAQEIRSRYERQLAGVIEKEIDGETKVYEFVRADRFSSRDDVQSFALAKGRQIIDEQGNTLFQQSWPTKLN